MSAYLQEVSCWIGQQQVFDKSSEAIGKLLHISVSDKQVERLCHHYGQMLEEQQIQALEQGETHRVDAKQQTAMHYVMVDGAQFLFREQGWKEAKLGRVFPACSLLEESPQRNWIKESLYVAHYGGHRGFEEKMQYYMDELSDVVIVADGASWIWNWAEAMYPGQRQILDFYHAMEHLGHFATDYFKKPPQAKAWIEQQKTCLLSDQVEQVIKVIEGLPPSRTIPTEQARVALIKYYQKNQKRMMYGTFQEEGLLIGSGPIEAAHRHVLQQRLKLSGQRWTVTGFQAVANLRATEKSQRWQKVIDLVQQKIAA
ncbi:hypothetical protein [Tunicatimonas pelagia]|uniref:hypothetical protein n=1 Tax=Tunicatimonas pelagia TaxID=931531 RepID=UPI0026668366|nr:hypothetical protein [Tunicatimonas pelagia]WKN40713.1 hypothetical protein P0M28_16870 [Tunicatimonas pelagia]WKN43799.1 hypothetical protein P0M28_02290 [Tunicatimonas pelagia]WKN44721.1 hypothetical protein P0M28_07055 [Tunicatimonas pelagia]